MGKRILYVNTPAYTGGAEISLLTLMRHLDPTRYQPILVTSADAELASSARAQNIEAVAHEFPWFRKRYPWRYIRSILGLALLARRRQVDLIHTNCDHSLRYAMRAASLVGVPFVSHVRDFVRTWFEPHNLAALRQAARIIANSNAMKERCVAEGLDADRIVVVYNAVDISKFGQCRQKDRATQLAELNIPTDAIVIGIVGQIQPLKGHSEFVAASLKIASLDPRVYFVIVGSSAPGAENDRFLDELQQRIAASPWSDRFRFTGFRSDISRVMHAIDVLAVPSWAESFGRVAVEGMAAGCAVIATRSGGLREIIEDGENGLLVPPRNMAALQTGISQLISDAELRQRLSVAGRSSADRFSVAKHIDAIQGVYDSVIDSAGSTGKDGSGGRFGS